MRIRNVIHKSFGRIVENDDESGLPTASAAKIRRMISFLQDMEVENEYRSIPS